MSLGNSTPVLRMKSFSAFLFCFLKSKSNCAIR